MRIIGYHPGRPPGPRWPTPDEIQFSHDVARQITYRYQHGIIRFWGDDEADAHMRGIVAAAMIEAAGRRRGRFLGVWFWWAVRWIRLAWR